MLHPIYMDNHATTRVDPRVVEAMFPSFGEHYGNAGSTGHHWGEEAREAVKAARETIATAIGAQSDEIVFTSGATESNNLAIRGVTGRRRRRGDHLVTVLTEHPAVLDPIGRLGKASQSGGAGFDVTWLEVEPHGSPRAGWLDPRRVAEVVREDTCLVSVMLANNEIGVVQPITEIARICRERGVLLHCDATQGVGTLPVNVGELGVDLMSFTAHKIYGPKGIGALYVRGRDPIVRLEPQMTGGGQEQGRRSGTLNVPGIVGLAEAMRLCQDEMSNEPARLASLRARLARGLFAGIEGLELCGPALDQLDTPGSPLRLSGNLMVTLGDVEGQAVQMRLPELAFSSGAACSSADSKPSHVLMALGLTEDQARSSLRFGLGRFNTAEEVDQAIELVTTAVSDLRGNR